VCSSDLHLVILGAFLYHTWTWFHIMPRTLPPILVNGERVTGTTITRAGLATATIASLVVLAIAMRLAS
jgi:fumarate reductase subunit C